MTGTARMRETREAQSGPNERRFRVISRRTAGGFTLIELMIVVASRRWMSSTVCWS
jgi:type II secretory pathway pseudopilin PulG